MRFLEHSLQKALYTTGALAVGLGLSLSVLTGCGRSKATSISIPTPYATTTPSLPTSTPTPKATPTPTMTPTPTPRPITHEEAISRVVRTYFELASKRDWKKIYDLYCEGIKRRYPFEDFRMLAVLSLAIGEADYFEDVIVNYTEIKNDRATANVSWVKVEVGGDRKKRNKTMQFFRENGKWLMGEEKYCD